MVLLFALTDHLGIAAASLSVVEILLVALQASGISTGIVPDNFLRDILWFGLHPCILVHSGGKNLDCLEPACLISPELLKLKIQLTCAASGLRILNRHSKGHQAIWKPHLIHHMVPSPHFFPCGNGRQCASKLTTASAKPPTTTALPGKQVLSPFRDVKPWIQRKGKGMGEPPLGCVH